MSPKFNCGDYILILKTKYIIKHIKVGSTLIFNHQKYGLLIKKVQSKDKSTNNLYFIGQNTNSITLEEIGPIGLNQILGKPLYIFKGKASKTLN